MLLAFASVHEVQTRPAFQVVPCSIVDRTHSHFINTLGPFLCLEVSILENEIRAYISNIKMDVPVCFFFFENILDSFQYKAWFDLKPEML